MSRIIKLSKQGSVILSLLLVLFLCLRLVNLGDLAAFTDEAGNILTSIDPEINAIIDPMGLGRPLLGIFYKVAGLFPAQALELGRATTVFFSFCSLIILFLLTRDLFNQKIALTATGIWTISTYHLAHERLALQDPISTFLLIFSCFFLVRAILLIKGQEAQKNLICSLMVLIAGSLFGLAILNKVSSLSALLWVLALPLLTCLTEVRELKILKQTFLGSLIFAFGCLLLILSQPGIFNFGRLLGGQEHTTTLSHLFSSPLQFLELYTANLLKVSGNYLDWSVAYVGFFGTGLLTLLILSGVFFSDWKQKGLVCIGLAYIFVNALMYSTHIYPRYIHHETVVIVIFAAREVCLLLGSTILRQKVLRALFISLIGLFVSESLLYDISVVFAAEDSCLNHRAEDYRSYTRQHWSGYRLPLLLQEIEQIAEADPRAIFLNNTTFDSSFYGLRLKTYRSSIRSRILPLYLSSRESAASYAGYRTKFPTANFYYIYSSHDTPANQVRIKTEVFLKTNATLFKKIARSQPDNTAYLILKLTGTTYDQENQRIFPTKKLPEDLSNVALISTEVLSECAFSDLQLRTYLDLQNLKILDSAKKLKAVEIRRDHNYPLSFFKLTAADLPLQIYSSKWEPTFTKSAYGYQHIRSLRLFCESKG